MAGRVCHLANARSDATTTPRTVGPWPKRVKPQT